MKVYLAAPYACRDGLRGLAAELVKIGMSVTSSWLTEKQAIDAGTVGAAADLADAQVRHHVQTDFRDIERADVLVAFTGAAAVRFNASNVSHSGGRHVETGYALALGKPVIVIGPPENVFHRGACTNVPDWHEAVLELVSIQRSQPRAGGAA
jgi:nucleoside 2-deoxyribosyltransferase